MPEQPADQIPAQAALRDVLVISVGHTLPGLHALAILRDLGAQVIRIERLQRNDRYEGMDVTFPIRSLTVGTHELQLDLKHEQGNVLFRRMAERADVLLEGFRPGVMQRLGLDHASLSPNNPRLVYAAISGYGQEGEYAQRPGHDINYLAETGVLALGYPPALPGATFADGMAGMSAALNIVAALHARDRSGQGQLIDCAIVDGPLSLMVSEFEHYWNTGQARGNASTHLTGSHGWYGLYDTADGRQVAVAAVEPPFYQNLCHGLGLPELASGQHSTGAQREQAQAQIARAIKARTQAELVALFADKPACISPIYETDQTLASPFAQRAVLETNAGKQVRSPVRLASADAFARPRPPLQLQTLLIERIGCTKNEIEKLVAEGIMACDI